MKKIIAISDTHFKQEEVNIPDGDFLVHAGDISAGKGSINQLQSFNEWLGTLPFDRNHIIITPGNHDFVFRDKHKLAMKIMSNARVLIDKEVIVDGIKFYGSPWQPWFGNWCYNLPRGIALQEKWAMIPKDADVVITHGPPHGILDYAPMSMEHCGCYDLLDRINEVKPKYHIFGHIHNGYGVEKNNHTVFVNASICDEGYRAVNKPVVVEI